MMTLEALLEIESTLAFLAKPLPIDTTFEQYQHWMKMQSKVANFVTGHAEPLIKIAIVAMMANVSQDRSGDYGASIDLRRELRE